MEVTPPDYRPACLPIHPVPVAVQVIQAERPGGWTTTVARLFRPGDAARCRLCPRGCCTADPSGLCLVEYPEFVPDHLAPLHPVVGDVPPAARRVD